MRGLKLNMAQNLKSYLIDGLANSQSFRSDKARREKADMFLQAAFGEQYDGLESVELDEATRLSANIMISSIDNMQALTKLKTEGVVKKTPLLTRTRESATSSIQSLRDTVNQFTENLNNKINEIENKSRDALNKGFDFAEARLESVADSIGHKFDKFKSFGRNLYYKSAVAFATGKQAFINHDENNPQFGMSAVTVKTFTENMTLLKNKLAEPFDSMMLNMKDFPKDSLLGRLQDRIYDSMDKRYDQVMAIEEKYANLKNVEFTNNAGFAYNAPVETPIADQPSPERDVPRPDLSHVEITNMESQAPTPAPVADDQPEPESASIDNGFVEDAGFVSNVPSAEQPLDIAFGQGDIEYDSVPTLTAAEFADFENAGLTFTDADALAYDETPALTDEDLNDLLGAGAPAL